MALESGTVYEGFRTGVSQGLFTVTGALHGNNTWLGDGTWQTASAIAAAKDAAAKKTGGHVEASARAAGGPARAEARQSESPSRRRTLHPRGPARFRPSIFAFAVRRLLHPRLPLLRNPRQIPIVLS